MSDFKRKNIRLPNFEYKGSYVYYITICTYNKTPFFANYQKADIIQDVIQYKIENHEIIVYCYCLMPDHLHLLMLLSENYKKDLSTWIKNFKRYTTNAFIREYKIKELWQRNYYDHIVRDDESLTTIGEYILNNPVRKNLVNFWEDYAYCRLCL